MKGRTDETPEFNAGFRMAKLRYHAFERDTESGTWRDWYFYADNAADADRIAESQGADKWTFSQIVGLDDTAAPTPGLKGTT